MTHEHSFACLAPGPGSSLVCNVTGESGTRVEEKASLRRDRLTGRHWLMFLSRPGAETIAALKAAGWRWSGYRKEWNHPSKFARVPTAIPYVGEGEVDYAAERGERLEERAGKHETIAEGARVRGERISGGIPLGQPILVGHHSERRHRRDIERIHSAIAKEMEHRGEAKRLEERAVSSTRHQAYVQSTPVTARRIERLKADLRSMERYFAGFVAAKSASPESLAEYARRMDIVRADIAKNEQALAEAGGVPASWSGVDIKRGDIVSARGGHFIVARVNPKSFSGYTVGGGSDAWPGKLDKTHFKKVVHKSNPLLLEALVHREKLRGYYGDDQWVRLINEGITLADRTQ